MLNRFFLRDRKILVGATCLGFFMGYSPSSEASPLHQYAGTYITTTMVIDGETAEPIMDYSVVGVALQPQGDALVGSLLVGSFEEAFGLGALSLMQDGEGITGEYWLPTFKLFGQNSIEEIPLTVNFDDNTETMNLEFLVTDTHFEFFPGLFPTPDGAGGEVQLVVKKLTDDNLASLQSLFNLYAIQNEAKQALRAMNRGQQAFFLEQDVFSGAIADLGLGIREETDNYIYGIYSNDLNTEIYMYALPKIDEVKTYISAAFAVIHDGQGFATTMTVVCESDGVTTTDFPYPSLNDGEPTCPEGFTAL